MPVVNGGGEIEVALAVAPVRGTRAETIREQRRVDNDISASAQSECLPKDLSSILDFVVLWIRSWYIVCVIA